MKQYPQEFATDVLKLDLATFYAVLEVQKKAVQKLQEIMQETQQNIVGVSREIRKRAREKKE